MLYDKLIEWIAGILSALGVLGHIWICAGLLLFVFDSTATKDIGFELLFVYSLPTGLLIFAQRLLPRHKDTPAIWFSLLGIPILGAILFERLPRRSFVRTGFDVLPPSRRADSNDSDT